MREHYDCNTPVVTLDCILCEKEFESYGITMQELKEIAIKHSDVLICGDCDP